MEGLIGRLKERNSVGVAGDPKDVLNRIRDRVEKEALILAQEACGSEEARRRLESYVANLLVRMGWFEEDPEGMASELVAELTGLGPVDRFIREPGVTEIMVNGPDQVWVERNGKLIKTDVRFRDANHVVAAVQRLIAPIGRRLDAAQPFVDAKLPDGSRLHAVIPPIAPQGPVVTIRRFADRLPDAGELLRGGTWTPELCSFLIRCVRKRLNILISGGTSSGKTTLLNVLASYIPHDSRLLTVEDSAELQIRHPHVITLEGRPPNQEGKGEITLRSLIRNALRMRPDRIIVGEVRGSEAFDLLQAWNTGHSGSLSTVHANSAKDALTRLETMVLMSPDRVPHAVADRLVRATVDVIVHMGRDEGRRFIQQVSVRSEDPDGPYREIYSSSRGFTEGRPDWIRKRFMRNEPRREAS